MKIIHESFMCIKIVFITGAGWGLQVASMTKDLQSWADGFPASADVRKLYTDELRAWLRDPTDLDLLITGVCSAYLVFSNRVETFSRFWVFKFRFTSMLIASGQNQRNLFV